MTPKVSFLIPSYNEEKTIRQCIESLLNMDYPKESIEIVIVDGGSKDHTIDIIREYPQVQLHTYLCNKPKARNIALENSTGQYIFNYSGHAIAQPNLLKTILPKFNNDIHIVGVPNNIPKQDILGINIGKASKGFLAGTTTNVYMQNVNVEKDTMVNHVPFSCYTKKVFNEVGKFNNELQYGQDAEFNIRCNKKGYQILFTNDTYIELYRPTTYKKLFWKMYNYGIARSEILRIHPDTFNKYYLIPLMFIPLTCIMTILTILNIIPNTFYGLIIFSYLFLCYISYNNVRSFIIYPIIHLGYSYGLLRGTLP